MANNMVKTMTYAQLIIALLVLIASSAALADAVPADADEALITRYNSELETLATTHGARAYELTEPHIALAFAHRRAGQHQLAVSHFEQALALEREHAGLESAAQKALIERLIETSFALADWPRAVRYIKLLSWVNERAEDTPQRVMAANWRLAAWLYRLSALDQRTPPGQHISHALKISAGAIARFEDSAIKPQEQLRWLSLHAGLAFRAARLLAATMPVVVDSRLSARSSLFMDDERRILHQHRISRQYIAGREALEQAWDVAVKSNNNNLKAEAAILLGDWHQLLGHRQRAAEHYARAHQFGDTAMSQRLQQARRLPAFIPTEVSSPSSAQNNQPLEYARTRFDIDKNGRARNIEVLETSPGNTDRLARLARRQLKQTRFRPGFDGRQMVARKGHEIRFVFPRAAVNAGARL